MVNPCRRCASWPTYKGGGKSPKRAISITHLFSVGYEHGGSHLHKTLKINYLRRQPAPRHPARDGPCHAPLQLSKGLGCGGEQFKLPIGEGETGAVSHPTDDLIAKGPVERIMDFGGVPLGLAVNHHYFPAGWHFPTLANDRSEIPVGFDLGVTGEHDAVNLGLVGILFVGGDGVGDIGFPHGKRRMPQDCLLRQQENDVFSFFCNPLKSNRLCKSSPPRA